MCLSAGLFFLPCLTPALASSSMQTETHLVIQANHASCVLGVGATPPSSCGAAAVGSAPSIPESAGAPSSLRAPVPPAAATAAAWPAAGGRQAAPGRRPAVAPPGSATASAVAAAGAEQTAAPAQAAQAGARDSAWCEDRELFAAFVTAAQGAGPQRVTGEQLLEKLQQHPQHSARFGRVSAASITAQLRMLQVLEASMVGDVIREWDESERCFF